MLSSERVITEGREQFHDNDFNANRKGIRYYWNDIMQNRTGTPNIFHRISHALLQLCINMSVFSHKTFTKMCIVFTKNNKNFLIHLYLNMRFSGKVSEVSSGLNFTHDSLTRETYSQGKNHCSSNRQIYFCIIVTYILGYALKTWDISIFDNICNSIKSYFFLI